VSAAFLGAFIPAMRVSKERRVVDPSFAEPRGLTPSNRHHLLTATRERNQVGERSANVAVYGADGFGGWREILVSEDQLEAARELMATTSPME
jgi:hypothetical protein